MKLSSARTVALPRDHLSRLMWIFTMATMALFLATQAHAKSLEANNFGDVQQNIATNASTMPKLIAMFTYVAGTFFAAAGLLKLKNWINDSERNTMLQAVMCLFVATLLILLPHTLRIATGTFFGRGDGSMSVTNNVAPGQLSVFGKHQ